MKNTQNGLKNRHNYDKNDNLFAGVWRLDQDNLDSYDPFIQGYAAIIWTALPRFFSKPEAQVGTKSISDEFKVMTERNFKAFSGISNLTLDSDQITHGVAGNELPVATNIKKENTSFTLKHYELSGSPIRNLYQYWITGIRDPETGLATYHGAIAAGMPYSIQNHTAELLYVVTDPSFAVGGKNGIEFAAYYTNVFPTTIPQDHLNYSSGDHGLTEIDIEFKGCYHQSNSVNSMAVKVMSTYKINKKMDDWNYHATTEGNGAIFDDTNGYNQKETDNK